MEWKVVYVGSPESHDHDQVLEQVQVGPIPLGLHKFVLSSVPPPCWEWIPLPHRLGVTVLLVTASYRQQEFCRIGYYVLNEVIQLSSPPQPCEISTSEPTRHQLEAATTDDDDRHVVGEKKNQELVPGSFSVAGEDDEDHKENVVVMVHDPSLVTRTILADKPRVTRYQIAWQEHDDDVVAGDAVQDDQEVEMEEHDDDLVIMGINHDHEADIDDDDDDEMEDDHMSSSSTTSSSMMMMEDAVDVTTTTTTMATTLPLAATTAFDNLSSSTDNNIRSRLVSPCHDAIRHA